jgi:3,4-dihydroxy 2-butanone 4-phosphate synthase/GTP cyclohydrolase II
VGDPFGTRPDLNASLAAIDSAGVGVFLYVFNKARTSLARSFERQVGRPESPVSGAAEVSADSPVRSDVLRDFGLGAQVLADLGCRKIRLMSNSQRRIAGLEGFGIEVTEWIPIPVPGEAATGRGTQLRTVRGASGARGGGAAAAGAGEE